MRIKPAEITDSAWAGFDGLVFCPFSVLVTNCDGGSSIVGAGAVADDDDAQACLRSAFRPGLGRGGTTGTELFILSRVKPLPEDELIAGNNTLPERFITGEDCGSGLLSLKLLISNELCGLFNGLVDCCNDAALNDFEKLPPFVACIYAFSGAVSACLCLSKSKEKKILQN